MKLKKHHHTVLSAVHCKSCGKRLKQNLVDRKGPNATHCYACYSNALSCWRNRPEHRAHIRLKEMI